MHHAASALAILIGILIVATLAQVGPQPERFHVGDDDAVSWLRKGILAIGEVPQLSLPGSAAGAGPAGVGTVPVRESTVWLDALAPSRDGIFVPAPNAASLAELVINERHPYAAYLRDYDETVLALRTVGRKPSAEALAAISMRDLERKAFVSVESPASGGATVYTLSPTFAHDPGAPRAAYAMLFAAAGARACIVNGSSIDAVLASVADLASMRTRNAAALQRVRAQSNADMTAATTTLTARYRDGVSRMASQKSAATARVRDLDSARAETSDAAAAARAQRATAASNFGTVRARIAGGRKDETAARAHLERIAAAHDSAGARLASVRRIWERSIAAQRSDETIVRDGLRGSRIDASRAHAAAARMKPLAKNSAREHARAMAHLDRMRGADRAARGRLEKASGSRVAIHRDHARIAKSLHDERARNDALKAKHAAVIADGRRLGRAQMEAAKTARERLERAMDANNETRSSYALWGRYASLTRLEDELDAHDDGLPGKRA